MNRFLIVISFFFSLIACIEPFEFQVRTAENILVVQATITDKPLKQQIFLKKASNLNQVNLRPEDYNPNVPIRPVEDLTKYEENASVIVLDDNGNKFVFSEIDPGTYESDIAFAAISGRTYQLLITTEANEIFESDIQSVPGASKINQVFAERGFNAEGDEGIAIYIDGQDSNRTSNFFRYEYEETYKIIAPNWTAVEFDVIFEGNGISELPILEIVPREQEEQICYGLDLSTDVLLASTENLVAPKIERSLIRFINRDNPILSHRYSILVRQYVHSLESHGYYKGLKNFSKTESVFSEIQPGFLQGNVNSSVEDEMVIGYFDVVSIDEKRIFFDYIDFFEGEELPPYFSNFNCDGFISPPLIKILGCPQRLPAQVRLELVEYYDVNATNEGCGPYLVTPRICGDCTVLGSNVKPDFWIE